MKRKKTATWKKNIPPQDLQPSSAGWSGKVLNFVSRNV